MGFATKMMDYLLKLVDFILGGELSTAFPGIKPVGKTIGPGQTLLSGGSRVSRKKEYAPDLMKACAGFSKTKDANGKVNDDQEDEDSFLEVRFNALTVSCIFVLKMMGLIGRGGGVQARRREARD